MLKVMWDSSYKIVAVLVNWECHYQVYREPVASLACCSMVDVDDRTISFCSRNILEALIWHHLITYQRMCCCVPGEAVVNLSVSLNVECC